jgi:hypothetical protein
MYPHIARLVNANWLYQIDGSSTIVSWLPTVNADAVHLTGP